MLHLIVINYLMKWCLQLDDFVPIINIEIALQMFEY